MVRTATFPHAVGIRDRTFLVDVPWGLGFHLKHVRPSLDDCGETATPGTFGHAGHFIASTAWADPGKDLCAAILTNGLVERRAGFAAVKALSQSIHDVVDAAVDSAR
jgi:CubicO group peptidase (beta-lactamase class C family)